jgi:hypothetical protein
MIESLVNSQIHENLQRYQAQLLVDGVINCPSREVPECFPHTTKKYVEVASGETLFVKENGEVFYQRSPKDHIIMVSDIKQIQQIGMPIQVKS